MQTTSSFSSSSPITVFWPLLLFSPLLALSPHLHLYFSSPHFLLLSLHLFSFAHPLVQLPPSLPLSLSTSPSSIVLSLALSLITPQTFPNNESCAASLPVPAPGPPCAPRQPASSSPPATVVAMKGRGEEGVERGTKKVCVRERERKRERKRKKEKKRERERENKCMSSSILKNEGNNISSHLCTLFLARLVMSLLSSSALLQLRLLPPFVCFCPPTRFFFQGLIKRRKMEG